MTQPEDQPIDPESLLPTTGEALTEALGVIAGMMPIPVAGTLVGHALQRGVSGRRERRLIQTLRQIVECAAHREERIDREFVRREEVQELAVDMLLDAERTWSAEKRAAIRGLFINGVLCGQMKFDALAEFHELTRRLQHNHFKILAVLHDPRGADESLGTPVGDESGFGSDSLSVILGKLLPGWDEGQIERTWKALYREELTNTNSTIGMMSKAGIRHLEGRLNEFGKRFVQMCHAE